MNIDKKKILITMLCVGILSTQSVSSISPTEIGLGDTSPNKDNETGNDEVQNDVVDTDSSDSIDKINDENKQDSSLTTKQAEQEALLIPDEVLRNALRSNLGLGADEYLTKANLATITEFTYDGSSNNSKINSIEGIGNLVNIRNLYLQDNNIQNINDEIKSLAFLDILNVSRNALNDDDFMKILESPVKRLSMNGNQLTDVSIQALNSSERAKQDIIDLELPGNRFTNIKLSNFESLMNLTVSWNSNVKNIELENMPILVNLLIGNNANMTDLVIKNLPSLTSLTLTENSSMKNLIIEDLPLLSSIPVTGNTELTNLTLTNLPGITSLELKSTKVTAFNGATLTNLRTLNTSNIKTDVIDASNWPTSLQTITANNVTFKTGSAAILADFNNLTSLSINNSGGINDIGSYIRNKFVKLTTLNANSLVDITTEQSNKILETVFASAKSRNKKWTISLKSNKITRFKKYIIESGLVTSSMGTDDRSNFMTKVTLDDNQIFEPSIARANWLTGLGNASSMLNQTFTSDIQIVNYSKNGNYTIPIFKDVNRMVKDNYPEAGLIVGDTKIIGTISARDIRGISNISKINATVSQNLNFVIQNDKVKEVKVSFRADVPQKQNTGGLDQKQYSATVTIPLKFKPTLSNLTTISVDMNDTTFDPNVGIEAWDDDGELTSQITSNWNPNNLKTAGAYTVTYSVTDSEGLTQTGTRKIVVVDPNITYANITDSNLKKALNTLLNKPLMDADIAVSDLASLSGTLNLSNQGIKDLSGLEHAINITTLNLSNNPDLENIDAVANLSKLSTIYLNNNTSLTSIEGIKDITTLKTVTLVGSNLDDQAIVNGLQNLSLSTFNIKDTKNIKDLSALKGVFADLTTLTMDNSSIENIDFLEGARLTTLNIVNNESLLNLNGAANIKTLKTINITGGASLEGFGDTWLSASDTVLETIVIDTMGEKMNLDSVAGVNTLKNLTIKNQGAATRITSDGVKITAPLTNFTLDLTNIKNIDSLSENTTLVDVKLENNQKLDSVDGLVNLPTMDTLTIYGNPMLVKIGSVANRNFSNLKNLYFYVNGGGSSPKLASIEGLKNTGMTSLTNLHLRSAGLTNLQGLEDLQSVTNLLDLSIMLNLETMQGLDNLERVNTLDASGTSNLSDVSNLNQLTTATTLNFSNTIKLKSFEGLSKLTNVTTLHAQSATGLIDTSGLTSLVEAETLNFQGATSLQNFIGLEALNKVTTLNASGATKLVNTAGLSALTEAGTLNFEGDTSLVTFAGLTSLETVGTMNASGAISLISTTGLSSLTTAGTLNFQGATSLQSFAGLQNLRTVSDTFRFDNIGNTKYLNIDALSQLRSIGTLITTNTSVNDYSNFSNLNIRSSYTADNAKITDSDLKKIMHITFTNADVSLRNNALTDISELNNINGSLKGVIRFAGNKITSLPSLANMNASILANVTEFTFNNNQIISLQDFTNSIPSHIKISATGQSINDGEIGVINGTDVTIHNQHIVKANQYATVSNVSPQGFSTPSDNTVTWKSPSLNVTLSYNFNYTDSFINFSGSYSAQTVQNTPPTIIADTLQVHRHQAWDPKVGITVVDIDQPNEGDLILEDTFTLIRSNIPLATKEHNGKKIQIVDPVASPGDYYYEFTVTDDAGATVQKRREVIILSDDAPTIDAPPIVVLKGDSNFDILNGINATIDSYVQDPYTPQKIQLTSDDISYVANNFDIDTPGEYEVEIIATNSTVNPAVSSSVVRKITVRANIPPVLTVPSDITLKVSEVGNFDPWDGVIFFDEVDTVAQLEATKELIGKVDRPTVGMDASEDGIYELEYRITDSDGNMVSDKRTIKVTNRMPEIKGANSKITLKDKTFTQDDLDTALRDGVTAEDHEDGDLTSSLIIPTIQLSSLNMGENEIEYSITDSDSNTFTVKRIVDILTNKAPILTVDPSEITLGIGQLDSFNIMDGVTATDEEDDSAGVNVLIETDKTKDEIIRPNLNTESSTVITYTAIDSDGNTVTDTRTYKVTNYEPIMTLQDTKLTIRQNKLTDVEFLDLLMKNVNVNDQEDGDITENVSIENGDMSKFSIGENQIQYIVMDSDGNRVSKSIIVHMESNEAPVLRFSSTGLGSQVELNAGEIDAYNDRLKEGIEISDDHDILAIDDIQVDAKLVKGLPSDEKIVQKISYTVIDSDGNTSLPLVREYSISDEKPKFDSASVALVKNDIEFVEGHFNDNLIEGIYFTDKESPDSVILSVTIQEKVSADVLSNRNVVSNDDINSLSYGNYTITYTILDSDGNTNTLIRNMIIHQNVAPLLELDNALSSISISSKEDFNPLENIKIIDKNDPDTKLTYHEEYIAPLPGESSIYKIIYVLENKYGATSTTVRQIVVTNMLPVITFSNPVLTLKQGEGIDLMEGVKANDQEDGDITHKISYSSIDIKALPIGNYKVIYSVKDNDGNTTSASRELHIVDNVHSSVINKESHQSNIIDDSTKTNNSDEVLDKSIAQESNVLDNSNTNLDTMVVKNESNNPFFISLLSIIGLGGFGTFILLFFKRRKKEESN